MTVENRFAVIELIENFIGWVLYDHKKLIDVLKTMDDVTNKISSMCDTISFLREDALELQQLRRRLDRSEISILEDYLAEC